MSNLSNSILPTHADTLALLRSLTDADPASLESVPVSVPFVLSDTIDPAMAGKMARGVLPAYPQSLFLAHLDNLRRLVIGGGVDRREDLFPLVVPTYYAESVAVCLDTGMRGISLPAADDRQVCALFFAAVLERVRREDRQAQAMDAAILEARRARDEREREKQARADAIVAGAVAVAIDGKGGAR